MLTINNVAEEYAGIFRNSLDTMQSFIKNSYATGWHLDEETAEKIANGALKVARETVEKTIKDHKKDLKNGFKLMIEDITSGREPSPELVAGTLESMSDEVISAVRTYAGNEAKNYKPQSIAWFWCHLMEYAAETSFSDVAQLFRKFWDERHAKVRK